MLHPILKIAIIFILFIPNYIFSQTVKLDFAAEVGYAPKNITTSITGALGSPYIVEEFSPVKIKNVGEKIYSGRYNAYINEMEIIPGFGQNPIALDITNNDYEVYFLNENKTYKSYSYTTDRGVAKKGFLVIVSEQNGTELLKEERIKYYQKERASSSYDQDKPAKFRREGDHYYLKLKNNSFVYLPSKSRDIPKAFPKHEKDISNFIKKNKIKTKNEEDIIKLANFIGIL